MASNLVSLGLGQHAESRFDDCRVVQYSPSSLEGKIELTRVSSMWGRQTNSVTSNAGDNYLDKFRTAQGTKTYMVDCNLLRCAEQPGAQVSRGPVKIGNGAWLMSGGTISDVGTFTIVCGDPSRRIWVC